jgi:GPI-anchor transamidase subunit T
LKLTSVNDFSAQHYTLFPLTLGQILREYGIAELDLSLNAGQWNYDSWGYPAEPGVGSGAELTAWMGEVEGNAKYVHIHAVPSALER